jgi:hypothetical protein
MPIREWETFYVIVGSSAAALIGLMFVVMALIADYRASEPQIGAFGTPTVVHFGAVLMQAAIMTAPWPKMAGLRLALGACGTAGLVYMLIVMRRAHRQSGYKPVFEDWLFHAVLPIVAYAAVLVAAVGLPSRPTPWLFVVGGATVLLLFVGIHNAWDTVTYIVIERWEKRAGAKGQAEP